MLCNKFFGRNFDNENKLFSKNIREVNKNKAEFESGMGTEKLADTQFYT